MLCCGKKMAKLNKLTFLLITTLLWLNSCSSISKDEHEGTAQYFETTTMRRATMLREREVMDSEIYHTLPDELESTYSSTVSETTIETSTTASTTTLAARQPLSSQFDDHSAEHDLFAALFAKGRYIRSVRPTTDFTKPIIVRLGICLKTIDEIIEKDQTMLASGCVKLKWLDEFLQWSPEEFRNLSWFAIPSSDVWIPDIAMINSPDPYLLTRKPAYTEITFTGEIGYYPSGRFNTRCHISLSFFPFDEQKCDFLFESWVYPTTGLILEPWYPEPIDMADFYMNHQWQMDRYTVKPIIVSYDGIDFSGVRFRFYFKRRTLYYRLLTILPCTLMSGLQCLSHTLAVEHSGRMGLLMSLFLASSVFQGNLAAQMPKSSEGVTLIQIYLMLFSTSLVISIIITMMNMHCWFRVPVSGTPDLGAMLWAYFFDTGKHHHQAHNAPPAGAPSSQGAATSPNAQQAPPIGQELSPKQEEDQLKPGNEQEKNEKDNEVVASSAKRRPSSVRLSSTRSSQDKLEELRAAPITSSKRRSSMRKHSIIRTSVEDMNQEKAAAIARGRRSSVLSRNEVLGLLAEHLENAQERKSSSDVAREAETGWDEIRQGIEEEDAEEIAGEAEAAEMMVEGAETALGVLLDSDNQEAREAIDVLLHCHSKEAETAAIEVLLNVAAEEEDDEQLSSSLSSSTSSNEPNEVFDEATKQDDKVFAENVAKEDEKGIAKDAAKDAKDAVAKEAEVVAASAPSAPNKGAAEKEHVVGRIGAGVVRGGAKTDAQMGRLAKGITEGVAKTADSPARMVKDSAKDSAKKDDESITKDAAEKYDKTKDFDKKDTAAKPVESAKDTAVKPVESAPPKDGVVDEKSAAPTDNVQEQEQPSTAQPQILHPSTGANQQDEMHPHHHHQHHHHHHDEERYAHHYHQAEPTPHGHEHPQGGPGDGHAHPHGMTLEQRKDRWVQFGMFIDRVFLYTWGIFNILCPVILFGIIPEFQRYFAVDD